MKPSLLLTGIGLREPHVDEFLEKKPGLAWVEVHSENYFADGGKSLIQLQSVRADYPVSLHGVGLSLGSNDEINWRHLKKLADLVNRIEPCLVSEHLSWSSINGLYFSDLLPLPYTDEAIEHIALRIRQVQDYLKRQILIENITTYVTWPDSTMPEQAFLSRVVELSGCGLLLDITNLYINSFNLGFDPLAYLRALPSDAVQEIHLAGFTSTMVDDRDILIDSHNRPVVPAVWDLYREAITLLGRKPTIIEWDTDLPALDSLYSEACRAETILKEAYVTSKCAS